MPKGHKNKKTVVCEGCLAPDRMVLAINPHLRIYKKIMGDLLPEASSSKTGPSKVPVMCWECRGILRNAQKFQKRARQAFELLTMKQKNIHPHLSTLMVVTKTNPDFEISFDYDQELLTEVKIEIENDTVTDVKYENELDVKPDAVDTDDLVVEFIKPESDISGDDNTEDLPEENYNALDTLKSETDTEDKAIEPVEDINEKLRMQIIVKRRKLSAKSKYKVIKFDENGTQKTCKRVNIDEEERNRRLEEERARESYLAASYKCESCVVVFPRKEEYTRHMNKFHTELNPYACHICDVRVSNKAKLRSHVNTHNFKYVCLLCSHESQYKSQHDRHCSSVHSRAVECRECGLRFQKWTDFYRHYDSNHKRFVCDYCGFRATNKERLVNHITVKHTDHVCVHCGKRYTLHHTLLRHIALRHTHAPAERAYCVECDVQFDNEALYTRHLKSSVKHKTRVGHPCPECGKVYAKNIGMQNHYKYIHLKQTKYYCEKCSRYFLNGFRLRTHIASFHNKIQPPKNKICSYCQRGFRTNRILENHIRTHTGERPFACEYCTATFAQKTALVMHTRAIHKVTIPYSNAPANE